MRSAWPLVRALRDPASVRGLDGAGWANLVSMARAESLIGSLAHRLKEEDVPARVRPVLDDLGENVFHLGALGSGHTIKLINNFFGMTVANAMAEAFAMADVAGVPRQSLYDVMAAGPLKSGMMEFVKGYGVDGDPNQLAFAIKNAAKDVGYYAQMAADAGVESVMSKCALGALTDARDNGRADDMVSQMVDYYADRFKG